MGTAIKIVLLAATLGVPTDVSNPSVSSWLARNAAPLVTVAPFSDASDLVPFAFMVGDARLVGLGEPTHGNHEIYRLKHRLFEFLAREKGFRHLGIEAPFAQSSYLDDYVVNGIGSAEEALSATTMWAWDVEEVADLLRWMRAWNADKPHGQKLRVFGFDMQSPERAAREVIEALDTLDSSLATIARRDFGTLAIPFTDPDELGYRPFLAEEADEAALTAVRRITEHFENNPQQLLRSYNEEDAARLRQTARNLLWWIEANHDDGAAYARIRDEAQAANIAWSLAQPGDDAKAVLWAHNVHLANLNSERLGSVDMAGRHLKRRFGDRFLAVGAFYANGEISALEAKPWGAVRSFATGHAKPHYLEGQFPPGLDIALVDLRTLPRSGDVREWFESPQRTRHSGGGYTDDAYAYATFDYVLPDAFDVIAFVRDSRATSPISPSDTKIAPPLPAAENLGFESVRDGGPAYWLDWPKQRRWGYRVSAETENSPEGRHHGRLCRLPGAMSADVGGTLVQYVDASPFRGKTLVLSALTSSDLAGGARAFLRMKVNPDPGDSAHHGAGTLADTLNGHPIQHERWQEQTVQVPVSPHAGYLMFGLTLVGDGCASIDSVRLESH